MSEINLTALADGLSQPARNALLKCCLWDVCVGAGPATAFVALGLIEVSTILDDSVQLSARGVALRAQLMMEQNDGS